MKYVLITGSSSGLGLEMAKELSFLGYGIILVSRNLKKLSIAKNMLNSKIKHYAIAKDLSKNKSIKGLVFQIKDLKIEAIIHNFGKKLDKDTHDIDIKILKKSIDINFLNSIEINNKLHNKLKGNPSKIIYISSTASLHAKASPCYTLSKSLINTYVKNISQHYANKNILICAVLPGIMDHKGSDWGKKKLSEPKRYAEIKNKQPLKRFITANEIAQNIALIISSKNLSLTGSVLKMDANEY